MRNTKKPIQLYRGTTQQHSDYAGPVGEITVDTEKYTVVVQNGVTGGVPLAREDTVVSLTNRIAAEESARATADTALQKSIADEASARETADTAIQKSVTDEVSARKAADTALSNRLDVVEPVLVASDFTGDTNTVKKYVDAAMKNRASLASPAFSGTPTAPTADKGTNSTQIATTAFVQTAVSSVAVTRSETVLTTPITAGASVTVPAYTVGAMTINVYVNGIKCRRGDTFSEVGNAGEQSTSVTFNDAIPENYDVEVVIG